MARWYSVKIPTNIAATNTFVHYHTPVPRPPAQKRMDKLGEASIRYKLIGYNGGYIEFPGYTPETEAQLKKERQEVIIAHQV